MRDGRIGIAVGDVTDKGVPAALVMARTALVLRAEARRSDSPGEILARANALLEPEMPARMFVTCLFAILEPATGRIVMANAGHNLPYIRTDDGVVELRATGMPLGLLPGMIYEETEGVDRPGQQRPPLLGRPRRGARPEPGDVRLPAPARGDGRRRRRQRAARPACSTRSIGSPARTGSRRTTSRSSPSGARRASPSEPPSEPDRSGLVTAFSIPGEEGNERLAMDRVAAAVAGLGLPPARLERLKTAVSETAMNAIEYGSQGSPEIPVDIVVETTAESIVVRITDRALSGGRSRATPRRPISS